MAKFFQVKATELENQFWFNHPRPNASPLGKHRIMSAHNPQINLPDTLESASYFTTDPFPIFEMDNFLDDAFYTALVEDVKTRNEFDRVFSNKGNKKKLSLRGRNFENFEESPFKRFVRFFMTDEFFDWFTLTHLPYFDLHGAEPVLIKDKSKVNLGKMREKAERGGRNEVYFDVEIHYSSIEKGGFIPPHTDAPKKRLSFVLYLPSETLPQEMQENLGTVFYKPKSGKDVWERFESGLLNSRKSEQFFEDHEVAHVSMFQPNKCIGFVKSEISWHAVAPNVFDYDRRAIVINIHEL